MDTEFVIRDIPVSIPVKHSLEFEIEEASLNIIKVKQRFSWTPKYMNLIKQNFVYDPETGFIYNRRFSRKIGYLNKSVGYLCVKMSDRELQVHQVAFAIMKGYLPEEIDHKDTNKFNNKWSNLREATHSDNRCNRIKQRNNTSGYKGVRWNERSQKWVAQIDRNNKRYTSHHNTKEEACAAYVVMAEKLHAEFINYG